MRAVFFVKRAKVRHFFKQFFLKFLPLLLQTNYSPDSSCQWLYKQAITSCLTLKKPTATSVFMLLNKTLFHACHFLAFVKSILNPNHKSFFRRPLKAYYCTHNLADRSSGCKERLGRVKLLALKNCIERIAEGSVAY
jgi:hypothetical protein